jgi:diaminopimelate decarboxylase
MIAKSCFEMRDAELVIGGVPVSAIGKQFETPLYVYDLDRLTLTYRDLRKALHGDIHLFYSLKANPSLCICAAYCEMGAGAEIASRGELDTALKAGFPTERIIFAGPGKRAVELEAAVGSDILSINVESLDELAVLGKIAARLKKRAGICLRVNPKENISGSHLQMGGGPSPFGLDEEIVDDAVNIIEADRWLTFRGIHVYVGNQILDAGSAIRNIENTLNIARRVGGAAAPQNGLQLVNLGGGLGIPYYPHQRPFEIDTFLKGLNRCIESAKKETLFRQTIFFLELGRYLVAGCGAFLTRIVCIKESRGRRFAVVDGGMNANSMATGNLGQKIRRKFPICPAGRMNEADTEQFDIVGPLCTPMDAYGSDYQGPCLEKGDILCVPLSGAYGRTASPAGFLSHPDCMEVAASGGELQCVRRRGTIEDILATQSLFDRRIASDST